MTYTYDNPNHAQRADERGNLFKPEREVQDVGISREKLAQYQQHGQNLIPGPNDTYIPTGSHFHTPSHRERSVSRFDVNEEIPQGPYLPDNYYQNDEDFLRWSQGHNKIHHMRLPRTRLPKMPKMPRMPKIRYPKGYF